MARHAQVEKQIRTATVVLDPDAGCEWSEGAYHAFAAYVQDRINARTGLDVTVETRRFGDAGGDIAADSYADRATVGDAVQDLWNEWCAEGWPGSPEADEVQSA